MQEERATNRDEMLFLVYIIYGRYLTIIFNKTAVKRSNIITST